MTTWAETSWILVFLYCNARGEERRELGEGAGEDDRTRAACVHCSVSFTCGLEEEDSWTIERSQLYLQLTTATAWLESDGWMVGYFFDLDLGVILSRSRQKLGDGSGCHRQLAVLSEIVKAAFSK